MSNIPSTNISPSAPAPPAPPPPPPSRPGNGSSSSGKEGDGGGGENQMTTTKKVARRSRWGSKPPAFSAAATTSAAAARVEPSVPGSNMSCVAPPTTVVVSEEDAMAALLASAEEARKAKLARGGDIHEQKQQQQRQQRQSRWNKGGGDDNSFRGGTAGGRNKRPRDYGDGYGGNRRDEGEVMNDGIGARHENRPPRHIVEDDDKQTGSGHPATTASTTEMKWGKEQQANDVDDDSNNDGNSSVKKQKQSQPQQKADFGLSGALAADENAGNVYNGIVLKFTEPPEARVPNTRWRLYVFRRTKNDASTAAAAATNNEEGDLLDVFNISKQSAYLFGREHSIADIPLSHPSISKQHCVLQFRALPCRDRPNNDNNKLRCRPYLMDLQSTNGTFINGIRIEDARYYELKKGDVITLGMSSREYVLLTEYSGSAGDGGLGMGTGS